MNRYPGGIYDDSLETQIKNTSANVAGTVQNLFPVPSEQTPAGSAPERTRSSEPGVPTEVRISGDVNESQSVKDDSIGTQLDNTRAQVAGTFVNLMDPNYLQAAAQNIGTYLNPSREKGGKMRNLPPNEDDSIQTQIMHTEAQVVETFKDLSASLVQAGEKIKGAFSGTTSAPPPKQQ